MNQLTVRGFGPELAQYIKLLAENEHISLNQAALRLMLKGAALDNSSNLCQLGNALDAFIGSWSAEEAQQFDQQTAQLRQIDDELWQ
ncbi:hypothetical protein [Candidatus Venteria ishoeyi]|uniref:Antitoxin n=1 Tax=Candidatus Venteria ishoeyi TaxID=1899563 RepID=A0A1H6FJ48_9GAMM|nr:hypothetical protein [Candidatus Venteria ishoeyi]MDM8545682.1 hypothetical protein [Candidatus Venteria ishoeyi]SEH09065.1 Uncharacterised protein [Candidatus Venteria ishoeyi]